LTLTLIVINAIKVGSIRSNFRTKAHQQQLREGNELTEEEKAFDNYYFSLPADKQAELRALDPPLLPYRELPQPRNIFPVYENDSAFSTADPRRLEAQTETDSWVTRERLLEVVSDLLTMLGASPDKAVQAHFDLIRIILQTPDAPTQLELAKRMGLTKQAVSVRAKKLLLAASLKAPGLVQRIDWFPLRADPEAKPPENYNPQS
jgi:hypothetical protein